MVPKLSNYVGRQYDLDEETRQKILTQLEEIDTRQQKREEQQKREIELSSLVAPAKYIKFIHDKERKLLSFTGKFDKVGVKALDLQTYEVIKYKYKYFFECYDPNDLDPYGLLIWPCNTTEAREVLHYLSKNETVLEITRNGRSRSKTTTYQINPPLD
jgi:hypothetical protein